MKVARWGNSLAVRLPASVVEALELKEGDDITLAAKDKGELQISKSPSREELIERLRMFRGRLPADFKFDRDELNER